MTTTDLGGFCRRYLEQWDGRATVRGRARHRVTDAEAAGALFPASLQPLAGHPAVQARGEAAVRELLVRTACNWQGGIASFEVEVVAGLCGRLANEGPGCPIPETARQVALTVATDECYHAYAAREFIADVERLTGIASVAPEDETVLLKGLVVARDATPDALSREVETMVLCFAEHFVTESLYGLTREAAAGSAFQIAMREHLIDEGRHQGFFRLFLRHLWSALDEERRRALGPVVPLFLDAFLCNAAAMRQTNLELLKQTGFAAQEADQIVRETFEALARRPGGGKWALPHAQHCLDLAASSGMLEHGPTRAAFLDHGWIEPQPTA